MKLELFTIHYNFIVIVKTTLRRRYSEAQRRLHEGSTKAQRRLNEGSIHNSQFAIYNSQLIYYRIYHIS